MWLISDYCSDTARKKRFISHACSWMHLFFSNKYLAGYPTSLSTVCLLTCPVYRQLANKKTASQPKSSSGED